MVYFVVIIKTWYTFFEALHLAILKMQNICQIVNSHKDIEEKTK